MRIWIQLLTLDPDPAFHFDSASQNDAGSGSATLVTVLVPQKDINQQKRYCIITCLEKFSKYQYCGFVFVSTRIEIQHFRSMLIRIRFRIQGFDDQKLRKKLHRKNIYFLIKKIAIYLSLGLLKARPSSGESSAPQKRTSTTSKHEISSLFYLLDPNPHSQ
jgi:hypothetical protein